MSNRYQLPSDSPSFVEKELLLNSTTTRNSPLQRDIVDSDMSFLMNEQMIKEGEDTISKREKIFLNMSCTNRIQNLEKPSLTRTDSTDLDSGNGSSDQQSQMVSLANLAFDSKISLASERFEIDVSRVSDHSEFGVPDISIDAQDFCKTNFQNIPRGNTDSIASDTLLYDILHSPGKERT